MDKVKLLKNRLKSDNDYFASTVNYSSVLANTSLDSKTNLDEELMHAVLFMNKTAKNLVVSMEELLQELALEVGFNPTDILDEKTFNDLLELYNRNVNVIKGVLNDDFSKLLEIHRNLASSVLGLSPLTSSLTNASDTGNKALHSVLSSIPSDVVDVLTQMNLLSLTETLHLVDFITDNAFKLNLLETYTNNIEFYKITNYPKGKINTDSVSQLRLTVGELNLLSSWVKSCNRYILDFRKLLSDDNSSSLSESERLLHFVYTKEVGRFIRCLDLLEVSIQRPRAGQDMQLFNVRKGEFVFLLKTFKIEAYKEMFEAPISSEFYLEVYGSKTDDLLEDTYKGLLLLSTHLNQDSVVFLELGSDEHLRDSYNNTISVLNDVIFKLGYSLDLPERKRHLENNELETTPYFIHFLLLKLFLVTYDEHLKSEILKAFKRVQ